MGPAENELREERATVGQAGRRQPALYAISAIGACALAIMGYAVFSLDSRPAGVVQSVATPIGSAPQDQALARADELVEWSLARVYAAFELEDEGAIYDALALAADGEALNALYLQRRAALVDRGFEASRQHILEIEVLTAQARSASDGLSVASEWRLLGHVGHEEHTHLRGNVYTADLTYGRRGGEWRIERFDLRDIDRTGAGELVVGDDADHETFREAGAE